MRIDFFYKRMNWRFLCVDVEPAVYSEFVQVTTVKESVGVHNSDKPLTQSADNISYIYKESEQKLLGTVCDARSFNGSIDSSQLVNNVEIEFVNALYDKSSSMDSLQISTDLLTESEKGLYLFFHFKSKA